jgi:ADP-heptose:LPS heptosyltransferase
MHGLIPGEYVCLHPGSRAEIRRWPAVRFAVVADELAARGFKVVLTGTHEESHLTASVAAQMQSPAVDLAGQTDLGTAAALLSKARLLVTNDTGVSHLADAMNTPSVILFSASDPNRWAPLDRTLHRVIAWAGSVLPGPVLAEINRLLQAERVSADG